MSETEPVITDASNIIIELVEKTFIVLVNDSLANEEFKQKLSIKLTPELISVIGKIISQTPNTFIDVEKACNDIIKDGKIDSKDIPQFIIIVKKMSSVPV